MKTLEKYPDEKLAITIDYSDRLPAGDPIVASDWLFAAGISSEETDRFTTTTQASAIIDGGSALGTYEIRNTILSAQGETIETRLSLFIKPGMTQAEFSA